MQEWTRQRATWAAGRVTPRLVEERTEQNIQPVGGMQRLHVVEYSRTTYYCMGRHCHDSTVHSKLCLYVVRLYVSMTRKTYSISGFPRGNSRDRTMTDT